VVATQPIHDRLKDQGVRHWKDGLAKNLLTPEEIAALNAADQAVAAVVAVDDFAAEELSARLVETAQPAKRPKPIAEPSVVTEPRSFGEGPAA
jgi:acyl-CoA dehydrogenase